MNLQRLFYRGRQFWLALHHRPAARELEQAHRILGPELFALFLQMQPGEQVHSIRVMQQLVTQGESHPDLLTAALLHDVGKIRRKLRLWERVWIVLVRFIGGSRSRRWGRPMDGDLSHLPFWKQPLVVAEQHPAWGADMVAAAGGSPVTVWLIRFHAANLADVEPVQEVRLLALLQIVDDNS